jgi:hypothetical protein
MISMLLIAALVAPVDALPGWHLVHSTDGERWYVAEAVTREGNMASTNVLVNYATPRGTGANAFRSVAVAVEFDCKQRKYRTTTQLTYANPDGQGALVPVESFDRSWWPVEKGEAMHDVAKQACHKSD